MYCKNCGAEMPEDAIFCGNCGMKIENAANPETKTDNSSYQPYIAEEKNEENAVIQNDTSAYSNSIPENDPCSCNPNGSDLNTTLWIALSVIEIITCCGGITGIIALIFAIIANNKKNQGNYGEAASNLKIAKVVFFVGIGLFVFSLIFTLASGLLYSITGI